MNRLCCRFGTFGEAYGQGYVNSITFRINELILEYDFHEVGAQWLHFVAANRDGSLFREMIEEFNKYNVIGGRIEDDHTVNCSISARFYGPKGRII